MMLPVESVHAHSMEAGVIETRVTRDNTGQTLAATKIKQPDKRHVPEQQLIHPDVISII